MSQKNGSPKSSVLKTVLLLLFLLVFLVAAGVVVLAYLPPEKRPIELPFNVPFGLKTAPVATVETDTAEEVLPAVNFAEVRFSSLQTLPVSQKGAWRKMVSSHGVFALVGKVDTAIMYAVENGKWVERQKLFPNNNAKGIESVALTAGLAVVERNERLFLFHKPMSNWRYLSMIVPDPRFPQMEIGAPVATPKHIFVPCLKRNSVLVFEPQQSTESGAATKASWNKTAELAAPETEDQAFGYAVAAQEDLVAVSTLCNATNGNCLGSVYLFERTQKGTWLQTEKFTAPDGDTDNLFGASLAFGKDVLYVGAPCDGGTLPCEGAVYPFLKIENSWTRFPKLKSAVPGEGERFGALVSALDNAVVVGAKRQGAVEVFTVAENQWSHGQTVGRSTAEENMNKEPAEIIVDLVSLGHNGLLLGTHMGSSQESGRRQLDVWSIEEKAASAENAGAAVSAANGLVAPPPLTEVTEDPYQPLLLSCEGITARACAETFCKESGKKKCRAEDVLKQAAAEAYLTSHRCPASNIQNQDGIYNCRTSSGETISSASASVGEKLCIPSVTPLAVGALTEKGKEEVLVAIGGRCNSDHRESGSYGYVMRWQNGTFVPRRNLSFFEKRYPSHIAQPAGLPYLEGGVIKVIGTFDNAEGRTDLVYCIGHEAKGYTRWDCMDTGPSEEGVYFPMWDNFAAVEKKRKQAGCVLAGAKKKKIDNNVFEDLVVSVECTKGLPIGQRKKTRKAEKHIIEILFDGTNFTLSGELPEEMAYWKTQNR